MPEEPIKNLPAEPAAPLIVRPENYDEDIEAIDQELKDLDDLYKTSKTELDRIRASKARGSLSFTHMQTANLISLKSQKLSLIKARQAIKKDRFKQSVQMQMLNGGGDADIPVYRVLEVLAMNGMNYEKIQQSQQKKISEAEEADFEDLVEAELVNDEKKVTTAPNELPEFNTGAYIPTVENKEDEQEKCVETEVFNPKTDIYEVVCDPTGKLYIVDLENSTIEETKFFDLALLGITPDERATVITGTDGLQTAKFRDADIEVVLIEEGDSK